MGNIKLPKGKEWDKIAEEAFNSGETHIFSDNYCRRKAEMQGGITMKRNRGTSGKIKQRSGMAAAAAAFILVPGITIAGTHLLSNKASTTGPADEVIVEPSSVESTTVLLEAITEAPEEEAAEVRQVGEFFQRNKWYEDEFVCVDSFTIEDVDLSQLDTDCIGRMEDYSRFVDDNGKLTVRDDPDGWKLLKTTVTYRNDSAEPREVCVDYSLCGISCYDGELERFELLEPYMYPDLNGWFSFKVTDGEQGSKNEVIVAPGGTGTVERAMLIREQDLDKALYICFDYEVNGASTLGKPCQYSVKLQDGAELTAEDMTVHEIVRDEQAAADFDSLYNYSEDHKVEFTVIPEGFSTGGAYEGKYHKEGESGGITPLGLATTDNVDELNGLMAKELEHDQAWTYELETIDPDTPDVGVIVNHRPDPDTPDTFNGYFDRDVLVKFNDTSDITGYVVRLYVHSSVTEEELNQFISGMKIVPVTE